MPLKKSPTETINTPQYKIKDVQRVHYFDSRYYKILYQIKKKKFEEHLPSVTEILGAYPKPFIATWRGNVGNERADQILWQANNKGSFIHYGAEVLIKKGIIIYNPLDNPIYTEAQIGKLMRKHKQVVVAQMQLEYIELYRLWTWFKLVKPTKITTEQTVYSIAHKFAGTLDLDCYIKEGTYMIAGSTPVKLKAGFYVVDYKTGKSVSDTYKMQLAAYIEAKLEGLPQLKNKYQGGLIIHTNEPKIKNGIEGLKTYVLNMSEQKKYFNNFKKVYEVYKIQKPVPTPKTFSMPSLLSLN